MKLPGAQAILDRYRDDDSARLRQAAYVGLVRLGQAALKDAENGLFDPSADVRNAVADTLARAGADGQGILADALPKLAGERMFVLADLDGSRLPKELVPTLSDLVRSGGVESAVAAHLLGEMKAKAAVPVLMKAVEDPAGAAQREALWALGQLGDASATDVVVRELNSESAELRAAAADALGGIGASRAVAALEALKGDYYVRVREAAEATLAKLTRPAVESPK